MFDHIQGKWVSIASEVPSHGVGKDYVRFHSDGRIEYLFEHESRMHQMLFTAEKNNDEYIIRPPKNYFLGDSLRIVISVISENEIGITRIGLTTVYRNIDREQPDFSAYSFV